MRVVHRADQPVVPWKNGRGTTREILVVPEGASPDDRVARLSLATVAEDGPFSTFSGIDRWIAVVEGPGMDLTVDGAPVALDPFRVVRFPGDAPTVGRLRGSPVRDLNLMVRRPARGAARILETTSILADRTTLLYVLSGSLGPLGEGDAAVLDAGERIEGRARVFVGEVEGP